MKHLKFAGFIVAALAIAAIVSRGGQTITGPDIMSHYYSSSNVGAPQYEGAIQVSASPARIASLYASSISASTVYLKIQDSGNGGVDNGPCIFVLPITANNYVSIGAAVGWKACAKGIYVAPFTDSACTVSAGNVLFYSIDFQ